jgi:hypothetical protein
MEDRCHWFENASGSYHIERHALPPAINVKTQERLATTGNGETNMIMQRQVWPLLASCIALSASLANDQQAAESGWFKDQKGCRYIDSKAKPDQAQAEWSGNCVDGLMDGTGELTIAFWDFRFKGEMARGFLVRGVAQYGDQSFEGTFAPDNRPGEGAYTSADGTIVRGVFWPKEGLLELEQILRNGTRYVGQMDPSTGAREGKGTLYYPNGTLYEGEFAKNEPNGQGVMKYANGTVYEGSFRAGERHGKGRQSFSGGSEYEGDFINGQYQGRGQLRYANGTTYTGQFVAGRRHGVGTLAYADGSTYVGEFLDDERHGIGRYMSADTIKEGEWKSDKLNGKCKIEVTGKMKYDGQCLDSKRSGIGHYENLETGEIYDGSFRADLLDGAGRYSKGRYVYEGTFRDGLKEGSGKEVNDDGSVYEGEFSRGRWHGHGVLHGKATNGSEVHYDGMFANDAMEGQGLLTVGSLRAEGEFKANTLHRGRVVTESGRTFEIDLDKDTILDVLPDGSTRPATDKELPDLSL